MKTGAVISAFTREHLSDEMIDPDRKIEHFNGPAQTSLHSSLKYRKILLTTELI